MMQDEFRAILAKRIALHPEDYIQTEVCWNEEISLLIANIDETVGFIRNECTDDELAWMSEIFDDIAAKVRNTDFIAAIEERLSNIHDDEQRHSIMAGLKYAKPYLV